MRHDVFAFYDYWLNTWAQSRRDMGLELPPGWQGWDDIVREGNEVY